MQIFTYDLLYTAMQKLSHDPSFLREARGLTGTILFRDDAGCAHMSFYQGIPVKSGDGVNYYGSEFIFTASEENWKKAFADDKRKGLYDMRGNLIQYDGSIYTFAAYSRAFFIIWSVVRDVYLSRQEGER